MWVKSLQFFKANRIYFKQYIDASQTNKSHIYGRGLIITNIMLIISYYYA